MKNLNLLMYADDLVVSSPSSAGLQQLLNAEHDVKYNASKTRVMMCHSREDQERVFPAFKLSNTNIAPCKKVKYLGHFLTEDVTDDDDMMMIFIGSTANCTCRQILLPA